MRQHSISQHSPHHEAGQLPSTPSPPSSEATTYTGARATSGPAPYLRAIDEACAQVRMDANSTQVGLRAGVMGVGGLQGQREG
jgi:hypothetical protein